LEYLNNNGIEVIAPSKIAGNSKSADEIIVDVIDMPENFAKGGRYNSFCFFSQID
jgi:hypothetical protein